MSSLVDCGDWLHPFMKMELAFDILLKIHRLLGLVAYLPFLRRCWKLPTELFCLLDSDSDCLSSPGDELEIALFILAIYGSFARSHSQFKEKNKLFLVSSLSSLSRYIAL